MKLLYPGLIALGVGLAAPTQAGLFDGGRLMPGLGMFGGGVTSGAGFSFTATPRPVPPPQLGFGDAVSAAALFVTPPPPPPPSVIRPEPKPSGGLPPRPTTPDAPVRPAAEPPVVPVLHPDVPLAPDLVEPLLPALPPLIADGGESPASAVPLPAPVLLLTAGLASLCLLRRRPS